MAQRRSLICPSCHKSEPRELTQRIYFPGEFPDLSQVDTGELRQRYQVAIAVAQRCQSREATGVSRLESAIEVFRLMRSAIGALHRTYSVMELRTWIIMIAYMLCEGRGVSITITTEFTARPTDS